jgi:multisubunit Na+/H+ antiporter MnhC subunit
MFQNGCPLCGYSATSKEIPVKTNKTRREKKHVQSVPLPIAFILASVVLLAFIALLAWFITR